MKTEPERDATQTSGGPRHKGGGAPAWSSSGRGRSKDLRSGGRGEWGEEGGRGVMWCGVEGERGKEEVKGVGPW